MQAADNVKFRDRFGVTGSGGLKSLVESHGVSARCIFLAPEGAEAAGCDANIRRIDVAIDVEISFIAVHAFAHGVGQPAHGENVAGPVEGESVVGIEALAGKNFLVNRRQARVIRLESMGQARGRHHPDDNAGRWRKAMIGQWKRRFRGRPGVGGGEDLPPTLARKSASN